MKQRSNHLGRANAVVVYAGAPSIKNKFVGLAVQAEDNEEHMVGVTEACLADTDHIPQGVRKGHYVHRGIVRGGVEVIMRE